jgi:hypothetical protein
MQDNHDNEAGGRRQFLKCMAWAGAGTLWLMKGGVLHAHALSEGAKAAATDASFSFAQISDSHIGFTRSRTWTWWVRCALGGAGQCAGRPSGFSAAHRRSHASVQA